MQFIRPTHPSSAGTAVLCIKQKTRVQMQRTEAYSHPVHISTHILPNTHNIHG